MKKKVSKTNLKGRALKKNQPVSQRERVERLRGHSSRRKTMRLLQGKKFPNKGGIGSRR